MCLILAKSMHQCSYLSLKHRNMHFIYSTQTLIRITIDFHKVQCNEPTLLTLNNFWCFSLISTKYAAVIMIASSYRFKCRSHTGRSSVCLLVGKCNRKVHDFKQWLLCPELLISVTNGFQPNIERLKMCSLNTFHVSDLLK